MNFEKVIRGIIKYMNAEMFKNMDEWHEFLARLAVARMVSNPQTLKKSLMDNMFIKTFAIFDEAGNVDIDGLMRDLKHVIENKGKVSFEIPLFGKFTFESADVDKLHRHINEA
jgi:hypothetical protein